MIERLLAPLTAALVLAAVAPAQEVRLSVESGRALLVTDHGVSPLTRGRGVPPVAGPGHFELAPGSRASLCWAGRCSIELRGPASVAWQPVAASDGLRLDFSALREADVEVRSGAVRLGLPGAWRARLEEGAYSLYGLPAGGVELVHRAGREARATWVGGEGFAPPPVPIHAGERARLQGQPVFHVRADSSPSAPEWGSSTWPWGSGGIPDQPDLALRQAPGWDASSPWPWTVEEEELEPWRRWDWPWQPPAAQGEAETDAPTTDAEPHSQAEPSGAPATEAPDAPERWLDPERSPGAPAAAVPDPDVTVSDGVDPHPEVGSDPTAGAQATANAEADAERASSEVPTRPDAPSETAPAAGPRSKDRPPSTHSEPAAPSNRLAVPNGSLSPPQAPERIAFVDEPAPWGDFDWPWETRGPAPSIPGMATDEPTPEPALPIAKPTQPGPRSDPSQPSAPSAQRPAQRPAADPLFGGNAPADGQAGFAPERLPDATAPGSESRADATDSKSDPASSRAQSQAEPGVDAEDDASAPSGESLPEPVPAHLRWEPEDDRLPPPSAYHAAHWRGLPEGAIEFHPRHAIQVGPPYEFRSLKDGSRELWLPPTSAEPLWYFSPNLDLRLFPGASLVLEQDGSIRYHRGTVRVLTADPARRF